MKYFISALLCLLFFVSGALASDELDKKLQDLQQVSKKIEEDKEKKKQDKYLENNDREKGISQRTGPTVDVKNGTPSVGYQWSTD